MDSNRWNSLIILCGLILTSYALAQLSHALRHREVIVQQTKQPEEKRSAAASPTQISMQTSFADSERSSKQGQAAQLLPSPRTEQTSQEIRLPPGIPVWIVIPAIELDATILPMKTRLINTRGQQVLQWDTPDLYAAGWHESSARLGEIGNTVFNGHHNTHGEVFGRLVDLQIGDQITVFSNEGIFYYIVNNKMILPEKYQQLNTRMENALWILPSEDERLTLVTCWPHNTNTHRLIIVAQPDGQLPTDPRY